MPAPRSLVQVHELLLANPQGLSALETSKRLGLARSVIALCLSTLGAERDGGGWTTKWKLRPGALLPERLVYPRRDRSNWRRERAIWRGMIRRCEDPLHDKWEFYGGRGITVCERWRESFEAFLADMGPRPSAAHSIDRVDNAKGYKPGNCRWATRLEQANNARTNLTLEHNGTTRTLAERERALGFRSGTIGQRLLRGWSIAEALTIPLRGRR